MKQKLYTSKSAVATNTFNDHLLMCSINSHIMASEMGYVPFQVNCFPSDILILCWTVDLSSNNNRYKEDQGQQIAGSTLDTCRKQI